MMISEKLEVISKGEGKTVKRPIEFVGFTRQKFDEWTKIRLIPSTKGIVFRVKFNGQKVYEVPLSYTSAIDSKSDHTTYLANKNGERIRTVEHILSALFGMEINSLLIEIDGSDEVPILDHSAEVFTKEIEKVGVVETGRKREVIKVLQPINFHYKDSFAMLRPSSGTYYSVFIRFNEPIGRQFFNVSLASNTYSKEIAWARSFIRTDCDDAYWEQCKNRIPSLSENIKDCPIPAFNKGKWIIKPKRKDEPVRHKLLDLIGDLAVLGYPVLADITVIWPGHDFNRRLVCYLGKLLEKSKHEMSLK
ncbi:MAG: UDP-3-O-acyl-N-acetylglucosamine deacetylase [Candidatus Blackburnbacteria bacterium]|nr:UDP-3-O-acyl-N-acetylglucosamine deacetylase [Candidatus Blackburnbacteria bacterium]